MPIRSSKKAVFLQQSRREHPPGSLKLATVPHPDERIQVTVVLRPASTPAARRKALERMAALLPGRRKHPGAAAFTRSHGARQKDVNAVKSFARAHGLKVVEADRAKRTVVLSATVSAFSRALGIVFTSHSWNGHVYRSYENQVSVPSSVASAVAAVLGMDNREMVEHHAFAHAAVVDHHTNPETVAQAYRFPADSRGRGQRIAIIELGGGFYKSDIKQYFRDLGLSTPRIGVVEVDGQKNNPSSKESIKKMLDAMGASSAAGPEPPLDRAEAVRALWTIESTLDLELAGAFAGEADIVIYFAPNNAQGKYRALTEALHSKEHPPTILCCSWGAAEESVPADAAKALDEVLQDAALRGITVCFSSGDRGDDCDSSGNPRVHFPASSPHVLSCGGTHWTRTSPDVHEVVWSEQLPSALAQSGGGVSKVFESPAWQKAAGVESKTGRSGRGVPDVAGKADMASGYCMRVGGYDVAMGGTSAAAPMWAGLLARLNHKLGTNVGFLNALLYAASFQSGLRDITEGNNGKFFAAGPGWDACTGLGTPDGERLLAALQPPTKKKKPRRR